MLGSSWERELRESEQNWDLMMAQCPGKGSHRLSTPSSEHLCAALMLCRGAAPCQSLLACPMLCPFLSAEQKEHLGESGWQQGCSGQATLALLVCCQPSTAPGSPAAPAQAPLPHSVLLPAPQHF